ncbi:MAG: hypothetical protein HWQ38_37760 [Nostoc sp. NMS7]|uniref:hypothetical protein n=1 Tax=Nostoc sp. NMS7 TaxID=2815391 RepID=UPI0025EEB954|nr:hypothetical protein [Nostoc sp. NMS7]MBN3951904.1 hypothetical protein [Nostoc sp. NMS7]
MAHPIYTRQQLEKLKLTEIKAIALQLALTPEGDRRNKDMWINTIIEHQSTQVQKLSVYGTQIGAPRPLVEMDGDDCIVDGEVVATITSDEDLTQPWVVKIGGVEVHRRNTWALAYDYVRHHSKHHTLPIAAPTYPAFEPQPIALPKVGESHFVGDFLLRCIEVGGEYAAVWDVVDQGVPMGEISMNWDCFWTHNLSLGLFATPQEAVVDLCESAWALEETPKPELEAKCATGILPGGHFRVFATNDPNVFAVYSRDSGKRYQVCLDSNSCTCPHWIYRHEQEGFEDKHILAVNAARREKFFTIARHGSCSRRGRGR